MTGIKSTIAFKKAYALKYIEENRNFQLHKKDREEKKKLVLTNMLYIESF